MKTFLLCLLSMIVIEASAQQWTGAVNTDWNTPGNWNPASVPSTSGIVTFDLASPPNNCVVNTAVTISQFTMSAGTLSITAPGSLTTSSTFTLSGGTFNAGNGTVNVPGNTLTISGGTLNAGTATFNIGNNMIINSPSSIIPGTSTVVFNGAGQQDVLAISDVQPGTIIFYNLEINKSNNSIIRFTASSSTDTFQINNMLTLTDGQFLGNGFIKIEKDALTHPGFDGSGIPIACTGPNPSVVTLEAPLAVTGVSNFVGILKSSPSVTVSVFRGGGDDTIRIGNFNAQFIVRRGIIQFPGNPPIISHFRNLQIEPEGTFISTSNYFFNGGEHINTGGTFNANNGTYVFNQLTVPGGTQLANHVENFNHLIIDISSNQFNPSANDTLVVNGNLTFRSGTITGGTNSAFNVKNNMSFEATMSATQTNTKLVFTGTADQNINFAPTVIDRWNASVTLNKPGGNLILNSPWTLDEPGQAFTFIKGVLLIPDTVNNYIYFTNNYSVSGASNISYVDGPVRVKRWTNDPFEFPIGNAGFYGPIRISDFWAGEDVIFSGQYIHQPSEFATQGTKQPPIVNISIREWWQIKRVSGSITGPPYLWLSFDNLRSGGVTDASKLRVSRWDVPTSTWQDRGNGGVNGNFVRSTGAVSQFSPFTLGSTDPVANPLPVHLISFTAAPRTQYNLLQWSVENETNFDRYIIESSADGLNFNTAGSIKGNNSPLQSTYEFRDTTLASKTFYRLKMVDVDGKFIYSKTVAVKRLDNGFVATISPNPGEHSIRITIVAETSSEAGIFISDISGKILYTTGIRIKKGINSYNYDLSRFVSGLYFIKISNDRHEQQVLRYMMK